MNEATDSAPTPAPARIETGSAGRRAVYVVAGCLCVAVGAVGVVVPGLPTTVFLLAASWLFARSSPALYRRLLSSPRLGGYLRAAERRAMPVRCKAAALASMWVGTGFACYLLAGRPWIAATIVALALVGSASVVFWVRTGDGATGSTSTADPTPQRVAATRPSSN